MDAKYIKKEIADLNGTGRTQAYYKMVTRVMNHEQFIDVLCRDGSLPRSTYKAVLTQIAEKLPGCLADGFSVKMTRWGCLRRGWVCVRICCPMLSNLAKPSATPAASR